MVTALSPILAWTILLAPLASACGIQLFGVHRRRLSAALAIGGLVMSFVCAAALVVHLLDAPATVAIERSIDWIALPGLTIPFGILIDRLSLLMTLVVTGVGSAIFIYATGYMADDHAYSRFFGVLSLFAFSMLMIVLANNWIQLFIGWELVGCSSYLLIGHWYAKPSAADAGKKAFMVNRVADFGFLLGILALWAISSPTAAGRTFHFQTQQHVLPTLVGAGVVPAAMLPLIGLLIFCGPIGKSAQFPLHVWLPDAMEGPTPVSALIHAATMVAAGVYLLCRAFWLFEAVPSVLRTMTVVGITTALLSACLALVENDLKRILAYSTLSQLGYMVMALGLGGRVVGMYHLTTHALFKALLFLAAGSVMHGTHEQDIWKLGGVRHSMRWTSLAFVIGGLSLCGVWPFSGFFSKDAILALAHEHHPFVYWLATLTAGLTAFYIARAWFVAFTGAARPSPGTPAASFGPEPPFLLSQESRGARDEAKRAGVAEGSAGSREADGRGHHGHESPPVMLLPLLVLAGLSLAGGFLGLPQFLGQEREVFHWGVAAISLIVVALGLVLAWLMYGARVVSAQQVVHALALPHSFVKRRYYVDEVYAWYVAAIQQRLIAGLCAWVERYVIIGAAVNGTAWVTQRLGRLLRRCQTGMVQMYALLFVLGVLWLLSRSPAR